MESIAKSSLKGVSKEKICGSALRAEPQLLFLLIVLRETAPRILQLLKQGKELLNFQHVDSGKIYVLKNIENWYRAQPCSYVVRGTKVFVEHRLVFVLVPSAAIP